MSSDSVTKRFDFVPKLNFINQKRGDGGDKAYEAYGAYEAYRAYGAYGLMGDGPSIKSS